MDWINLKRISVKMDNCPECNGKIYDDGEEVACKVCGYVKDEPITKGSWRDESRGR